jgi:hypothetical protein
MDITNMYIGAGVAGGVLSVILLIFVIIASVRNVVILASNEEMVPSHGARFSIWCFGAALGSLAVSGLSTSFFDQSGAFVWIFAAIISSILEGFHAAENSAVDVSEGLGDFETIPKQRIADFHASKSQASH